jgi:hypothetical protein
MKDFLKKNLLHVLCEEIANEIGRMSLLLMKET